MTEEKREKRPHWRPWIGSWLRVPRRPFSRRAGVAARPLRPSRRPFRARWNWPCGQSRSGGAATRYRQRWSPLPPHHRSRSLKPSTRPQNREVVNMLDALKFETEGEGENSSHCKQNATAKTNTLDESIADAEPKSDETSKDLGDAVKKYRPNNDAETKVSADEAPLASLLRWLMSHHAAWAMGRMAAAVISSIFGHRNADEQWHEAAGADGSQPRTPETIPETTDDATMGRLRCRPGSSM